MKNAVDINWWDKLKHAVARYLLASEVSKVALERTTFMRLREDLERQRAEFDKEKDSYTYTDMVREQLIGFDPHILDTDDDLPGVLGEVEGEDAFLAKMKALNENKELSLLIAYLKRHQILYSATTAKTLDEINFGRATINGFELLTEEIGRLATVYADRHAKDEEFDQHEAV